MRTAMLINQIALEAHLMMLVYFQYHNLTGLESLVAFHNIIIFGVFSLIPTVMLKLDAPVNKRYGVAFFFSNLLQMCFLFFACGLRAIPLTAFIAILAVWAIWNVFALYQTFRLCSKDDVSLMAVLHLFVKKK